jgi:hypothetical protein
MIRLDNLIYIDALDLMEAFTVICQRNIERAVYKCLPHRDVSLMIQYGITVDSIGPYGKYLVAITVDPFDRAKSQSR